MDEDPFADPPGTMRETPWSEPDEALDTDGQAELDRRLRQAEEARKSMGGAEESLADLDRLRQERGGRT